MRKQPQTLAEATALAPEQREKLQHKILAAFKTEMKTLRKPMQRIIADDLVTAFEGRIAAIHGVQEKISQKRG